MGCYSETIFTAASRAVQLTLAVVCKITEGEKKLSAIS